MHTLRTVYTVYSVVFHGNGTKKTTTITSKTYCGLQLAQADLGHCLTIFLIPNAYAYFQKHIQLESISREL